MKAELRVVISIIWMNSKEQNPIEDLSHREKSQR